MLFSKKNFKTLSRALRTEPLPLIVNNLFKKLRGKIPKNRFAQDGILLHIDTFVKQRKKLYIIGWVVCADPVEVFLKINGESKFEIKLNTIRADVNIKFKNIRFDQKVGFTSILDINKQILDAKIRIESLQTSVNFDLNPLLPTKGLKDIPLRLQYTLFQHQKSSTPKDLAPLSLKYQPLLTIITPVYNTDSKWLELCIESVLNQTYANWELILYDDASSNQDTLDQLNSWQGKDERIKIFYGSKNEHISIASNKALQHASGEFIAFLDHDDTLYENALLEVIKSINKNPNLCLIYSDEDKINRFGHYSGPYFKPNFSIDHIRSNNYMCHFLVIKKSVGDKVGWFQKGLEGAQDFDLILKVIDQCRIEQICHIPKVLYSWRITPGSTALSFDQKEYALIAGKKAIESHLKRNKIAGEILNGPWKGAYRVKYAINRNPKVSIIIPFKDQITLLKSCIKSIIKRTDYQNYELILVDNQSQDKRTKKYLNKILRKYNHVQVIKFNDRFNFSKINNYAVQYASGEYLLLLNNDTKVITQGWLSNMVEILQQDHVGAVGPKLLYKDKSIQHAGVVTGIGGSAGHIFKGRPNFPQYFTSGIIRNVGAVTGACILVKKSIYTKVGGLESEHLKIAYNDIDLCLKIRREGYTITYTPHTELYHYESKSRGYEDTPEKKARHDKEKKYLQDKWGDYLIKDPYYNPNFSLHTEQLTLKID